MVLCIVTGIFLTFVSFEVSNSIRHDKIIRGYEIDEMIDAKTGKVFYDTVGVIYKENEKYMIVRTGEKNEPVR
jgi:hypothetical protein